MKTEPYSPPPAHTLPIPIGIQQLMPVAVFMAGMATLIAVGDGKQSVADAVGMATALGTYIIAIMARREGAIGAFLQTGRSWIPLYAHLCVSVAITDDIGYTVFAASRIVAAYLVYRAFLAVASDRMMVLFSRMWSAVAAFAIVYAAGTSVFPSMKEHVPLMNFQQPIYGHNHLSDILLPTIPMIVYGFELTPAVLLPGVLVVLLGIILSFGRLSMGLAVGVLMSIPFVMKRKTVSKRIFLVTALIFAAGALVLTIMPVDRLRQVVPQSFIPGTAKQPLSDSIRKEYFRQAIGSFGERPFLGSGPGTFYLQSKRIGKDSVSYSWFAHSFPLESLAEYGLVGSAALAFVVFVTWKQALSYGMEGDPSKRYRRILFMMSPAVLLISSLGDYVMNYYAVWLLYWASMGLLGHGERTRNRFDAVIPAVSVGAGVSLYAVIMLGYLIGWPVSILSASDSIKSLRVDHGYTDIEAILAVHRRHPDVIFAAAEASMGNSDPRAESLFKTAILLNPHDNALTTNAFRTFIQTHNDTALVWLLDVLRGRYVPQADRKRFIRAVTPGVSGSSRQLLEFAGIPATSAELLSKTLYYLAASDGTDPADTEFLLSVARDATPGWGYFHIELASYQYHVLHDEGKARATLVACGAFQEAKRQCAESVPETLPAPGSQRQQIGRIPVVQ